MTTAQTSTLARLLIVCAASAVLLCSSGCRKAAVERMPGTAATITPSLNVGDTPYILRPKDPGKAPAPWYREFQVIFDQRPEDEAQLEAYINENRGPVVEATNALLAEIATGVEAQRRPQDNWSLLTAWCGRLKKGGEISFIADVGLTKVFVRRPGISFQQLPLELAVAKLARESGITDSVPRGYSPLVTWSETDVSVKEAYDAFLPKYGFERRYQDIQGRVTLRMQDFAFRKDFVTSAVNGILAEGKRLNSTRGGIIVTPKDTPVVPEPPPKDERAVPVPPDPKKK
jgi:hypothetical protein